MTTSTETTHLEKQLVVFDLASEAYGVEIYAVKEIIRMQELTRIPKTDAYVEGVINLRGKVTPVINLRKRFGLRVSEVTKDNRILVVEVGNQDIGVIVDAVREVMRIPVSSIEPPSSIITSADSEYLMGIAKLEDRMVILLDLEKALFDDAKDAPQYKEPDAPTKSETPDGAPGLNVELLEKSFMKIATRGEEFAAAFYDKLFAMYPESKAFFVDTDMKEQQKKLFSSLVLIVNNLRKPDVLGPVLKQLGERHKELHVKDEHYPMVGDALLETLSDFLGSKWTPKLKKAWSDAYAAIVDGMTKG